MRTTLKMPKKFDFEQSNWFRDSLKKLHEKDKELSIDFDFADCDYLDSSALGMLLVAREKVGRNGCQLINVGGAVMQVLRIANFQRLFPIVEKTQ